MEGLDASTERWVYIYMYVYVSDVSCCDVVCFQYIYLQEKMTVRHDGCVGRAYGAISHVPHGLFLPLFGRGPIGKSDGPSTTSRSRPAFGRGRGMRRDRAVTPPVGVKTAPSSSSGPQPPHVLTSPATSASLAKPSFGRVRASRFLPLIPSLHSSTISSTPPPPGAFIGGGGTLKPHPYPPLIPSIDLRITSSATTPPPLYGRGKGFHLCSSPPIPSVGRLTSSSPLRAPNSSSLVCAPRSSLSTVSSPLRSPPPAPPSSPVEKRMGICINEHKTWRCRRRCISSSSTSSIRLHNHYDPDDEEMSRRLETAIRIVVHGQKNAIM